MKLNTTVGAVGIALAGAAVAQNTNLPRPGTPAFDAEVKRVRAMIDAGLIHPSQCLLDAYRLGYKTLTANAAMNRRFDQPFPNSGVVRGVNDNIAGVEFDFFDGFESYIVDPDPSDGVFVELDDQISPSGLAANASSFFIVVDWDNPLNVPQILGEPRDPFNGATPPGGDVDPTRNQVLLNGQGWFGSALTGTFLGYSLTVDDVFIPSPSQALVVCADFYFDDYETSVPWSPTSSLEDFIVTRILMTGYSFGSPLAEPNGQIRRPQTLGPAGGFTFGQFFAPPIDPAPGLATKHVQLQEWFTVAVQLTTSTTRVFMRDSQTDGSAGTTIDDQRDFQFFELGWTEIYPGQIATDLGGGVFAGHGRAVNDFMSPAPDPAPILAAITCDGVFTIIGSDPTPGELPGWLPTNNYTDNFCIIGDILPKPCPWDLNGDGAVGAGDLALLAGSWGNPGCAGVPSCPADFDGDGDVGSADQAQLLGAWGACP